MDYTLYKGILEEAKKHRLKLIGLNVQRDLVRRVAEQGIESLTAEDQAQLPEMTWIETGPTSVLLQRSPGRSCKRLRTVLPGPMSLGRGDGRGII
jgi:hypothetical protein